MTDNETTKGIEHLPDIDADYSGKLATGLFVGVIMVLLVFIYAFASAA